MINVCAPALIYLIFSVTQILIDTYNGMYNTAVIKGVVTVMVTMLLNILCQQGLSVVSWIIVFIPFILMTVVVTMILYIFGLDAATGVVKPPSNLDGVTTDASGNIVIYDPEYNPAQHPVYFQSPNIIVPNPNANNTTTTTTTKTSTYQPPFPTGSSSPAYQST